VLELDVPDAQYSEFTRGLAGIGGWIPREELMPAILEAVSTGVISTGARVSAHRRTPHDEPVDTGVLIQVHVTVVRSRAR
jgi:hypothetical protein